MLLLFLGPFHQSIECPPFLHAPCPSPVWELHFEKKNISLIAFRQIFQNILSELSSEERSLELNLSYSQQSYRGFKFSCTDIKSKVLL